MNHHILHGENISNNDQVHEVKTEQALRRSTRMRRSAISNRYFFCTTNSYSITQTRCGVRIQTIIEQPFKKINFY